MISKTYPTESDVFNKIINCMMGIFSNFNSLRKLLHPSFSLFGDKTASRAVPSYFPLIAPRVILYNQLFANKKILKSTF